jgi:flagellar biosynthesis protein FlhF
MRIRTFRAANATQAMAQVKNELGNDAVILSTKNLTEGGQEICEVTAAVERMPLSVVPQGGGGGGKKVEPKTSAKDVARAALAAIEEDEAEELRTEVASRFEKPEAPTGSKSEDELSRELSHIKNCLYALMEERMDLDKLTPLNRRAVEYLREEGVAQNILMQLYKELVRSKDRTLLSALSEHAPIKPWGRSRFPEKFHVFSGPAGVGKTTAMVRMALAVKRAHSGVRICMACADGARAKSRMVLRHLCELAGLNYVSAASREDMGRVLDNAPAYDMVFIDAPAMDQGVGFTEWCKLMGIAPGTVDAVSHIVLSPHYSSAQIKRFLKTYSTVDTGSIVWTKLDEACSYATMINAAHASGLPASAFSYGQAVRNSLTPANRTALWKIIFKHELPYRANETQCA